MKQLISILFLFPLLIGLSAASVKPSGLVGKWKGEDGGEVGFITFDKKGYVTFFIRDQEIGGKKYLSEGVLYDMLYETDESAEPYKIDFVIKLIADGSEISRMPGIYKLIDQNTLVINMKFDGSVRPTQFEDESHDQIMLRKLKL